MKGDVVPASELRSRDQPEAVLVHDGEDVVSVCGFELAGRAKAANADALPVSADGLDLHTVEPMGSLDGQIDPPSLCHGEEDRRPFREKERGDKVFPCRPEIVALDRAAEVSGCLPNWPRICIPRREDT